MDKILVVDDDALGRHNVVYFLRLEDYEVDEACDGNQAVLLLDQVKFDLVLSDIMMPGLDGLGLLKHVQSVAPDIPVLLMSGFSHIELDEIIKRQWILLSSRSTSMCCYQRLGEPLIQSLWSSGRFLGFSEPSNSGQQSFAS
jgi:CheY-like chemotaxis protein